MSVKIMAVGDVVSQKGADMFSQRFHALKKLKGIDFTVVNGENAAMMGITRRQARQLLDTGADVITLGNHSFSKPEIFDFLDDERRILRPANFAPQTPGRGSGVFETAFGQVLVVNLIGRCGMDFGPDNPFFEIDRILKRDSCGIVLVDFHAEATSEKTAMAHYIDGRASALWGTHTHVQTSDACVLPRGTGYITDLGMTGPIESVLGIDPEQSIGKFMGDPPTRYNSANGAVKLEGCIFEIDPETGKCLVARAVRLTEQDMKP